MKIPCDTIARLSHLLPNDSSDGPFDCFRLESGKVIVTDRQFMAIEQVEQFEGVFYIRNDPALIEQCRTEAQWSSVVEFNPIPAAGITTAMTTMGWKSPGNVGLFPTESTDYDQWFTKIVEPTLEPLTETKGPMVFSADGLARLAATSPSGGVALEQFVDPRNRATVVRDIDTHDWVGFFKAQIIDGRAHVGASVPGWCR